MTSQREVDFIIVGQGLAGTVLAHLLLEQNKTIHIFDNSHKGASSTKAAGIINPVTGRRFVKSWMVEQLLPLAKKVYGSIENKLNTKIYEEKKILRGLPSPMEENDFHARCLDPDYQPYLQIQPTQNPWESVATPVYKIGQINRGGRLNVPMLLQSYFNYFNKNGLITRELFKYDKITFKDDFCEYKNIKCKKILFCEGHAARFNPWFKDLPFRVAKGEMFHIRIPDTSISYLYKNKAFLVPLGKDQYWVGSTFQWHFENDLPTDAERKYLKEKLDKTILPGYEIVDHQAAIRPTVIDRRPLLGLNEQHPALGIFNGMGTKGASLAPYWANHFVEFLLYNKTLDNQVSIHRKK